MGAPKAAPPVARVRLFGEEIALKGDDPTRLQRLAEDLNGRLLKLSEELNLKAQPSKAALLVALNLLDELDRVRSEFDRLAHGTDTRANAMLERIDSLLAGEEPVPA